MDAVFGGVIWLQNRVIFLLLGIPILIEIVMKEDKIIHCCLHSLIIIDLGTYKFKNLNTRKITPK